MITVTKIFEFAYAHTLPEHKGKCKNLHGHNAILEVELSGAMDLATGMVEDFGDLKQVVKDQVLDALDHHYLNDVLPNVPTAENMCRWIVQKLEYAYGQRLVRVRVWETRDSYAEWRA